MHPVNSDIFGTNSDLNLICQSYTFPNHDSLKNWEIKHKPHQVKDLYLQMAEEYFLVTHPHIFFGDKNEKHKFIAELKSELRNNTHLGKWFYFPWNKYLFHVLDQKEYLLLRTVRNRNLISESDQLKLFEKKIAIIGLSVGKNTILTLARMGIGGHYTLSDSDTIELTNFNRATYSLTDYGDKKVHATYKDLKSIDPFLEININTSGVDETILEEIVSQHDLIIDTFDSFKEKMILRLLARKYNKPVISGVDIEHGCLLIVERYDLDKNLDLSVFLNHLDPKSLEKNDISKKEITNFFIEMIGKELHSPALLASVLSVGIELTSYPQLITASQILSSALCFCSQKILLSSQLSSGRYHIDLNHLTAKSII